MARGAKADFVFAQLVALRELVPQLNVDPDRRYQALLNSPRGPLASLAALRAVSTGCRAGVGAALQSVTRGLCPADARALRLAPLLPAVEALCLTRVRLSPDLLTLLPAVPGVWHALRSLDMSHCDWLNAAALRLVVSATPRVTELRAAYCTQLDAGDDGAAGATGAALLPLAPRLEFLDVSHSPISSRSLAALLPACTALQRLELEGVLRLTRVCGVARGEAAPFTLDAVALLSGLRALASHRTLTALNVAFAPSCYKSSSPFPDGWTLAATLAPAAGVLREIVCDTVSAATAAALAAPPFAPCDIYAHQNDRTLHARASATYIMQHSQHSHGATHAVRCDWTTLRTLLRVAVADVMCKPPDDGSNSLSAVALLGNCHGLIAHFDTRGLGADDPDWDGSSGGFPDPGDLVILRVRRADGCDDDDDWHVAARLQHNPVRYNVSYDDGGPLLDGVQGCKFSPARIEDVLASEAHRAFAKDDTAVTHIRMFALAVPPHMRRGYEPRNAVEHEWLMLPHFSVPRTPAQDAARAADMLEWARAAKSRIFPPGGPGTHDEMSQGDWRPWVNPQLMAVASAPGGEFLHGLDEAKREAQETQPGHWNWWH